MEYKTLSTVKNEIRLIKIRSTPNHDSPVAFRLEHASLNDKPDYIALSYCWGDPLKRQDMQILQGLKNQNTPITYSATANLANALRELRLRGELRVWADAVCIDQKNDDERGQQVLRMDVIYRCAKKTVSYLGGPSSCNSNSSIPDLGEFFHLTTSVMWNPSRDHSAGWNAFCSLLNNNYWSRVWIIQEIAMVETVQVYWNGQTLDLDNLFQAISYLGNFVQSGRSKPELTISQWLHIMELRSFRNDRKYSRRVHILKAFLRTRASESIDSRDRLFALLRLAYNGSDAAYFPNYTQHVKTLNQDISQEDYKRFTIQCKARCVSGLAFVVMTCLYKSSTLPMLLSGDSLCTGVSIGVRHRCSSPDVGKYLFLV